MAFDPNLLAAALGDPTIAAMDDADAAVALSEAILTPQPNPVTVTSLAAAWGFPKLVAAMAAFQSVAASGGANGAEASALLAILSGPGFSASNPQVPSLIPVFVGFANGAITEQDATNAIFVTSYRCGGTVQAQDVNTARSAITLQSGYAVARRLAASQYNAAMNWLDQQSQSGLSAPDTAALLSFLSTVSS